MTIKRWKKIWNILGGLLVALAVAIFVVPRFFGYVPLGMCSAGVRCEYPQGSLLYIQKIQPEKLRVGEPIAYYRGTLKRQPIVRRITRIDYSNGQFMANQDDSDFAADIVPFSDLYGAPVSFYLPGLGTAFTELQTLPGMVILFFLVGTYLVLNYYFGALAKGEWPPPTEFR